MEVNKKILEVYHVWYQSLGLDTTSLSKLFIIMMYSVFDL